MKKLLTESDFNEFPKLNESMLAIVDDMMKYDVPTLMKKLPQEQRYKEELAENRGRDQTTRGPALGVRGVTWSPA